MAGYKTSPERSLEGTPTWAVAVVCFVIVLISIFIEHLMHLLGHSLKKKNKPALYEALEKIKAELMLLGFISLLLVVIGDNISRICVPQTVGDIVGILAARLILRGSKEGKVALVSSYSIHQLHIFIFVLALVHVLNCILTLALGTIKMRRWRKWEDETKTIEYQYSHDPERFRFARDTSFGRRHLNFWSQSSILLGIVRTCTLTSSINIFTHAF